MQTKKLNKMLAERNPHGVRINAVGQQNGARLTSLIQGEQAIAMRWCRMLTKVAMRSLRAEMGVVCQAPEARHFFVEFGRQGNFTICGLTRSEPEHGGRVVYVGVSKRWKHDLEQPQI